MSTLNTGMSVCFSQGHKYVVQAEVLYKSWELDESQLAFIRMLQGLEKNEMRGTFFRQSNCQLQPQPPGKGFFFPLKFFWNKSFFAWLI